MKMTSNQCQKQPDSKGNGQPDNIHVVPELPNYLINPSKKEENGEFLCDVSEDKNETRVYYDSDANTNKVKDIDNEENRVQLFGLTSITDQDANKSIAVDNSNMLEFKQRIRKNVNPERLQIHCIPDDWKESSLKIDKGKFPF